MPRPVAGKFPLSYSPFPDLRAPARAPLNPRELSDLSPYHPALYPRFRRRAVCLE